MSDVSTDKGTSSDEEEDQSAEPTGTEHEEEEVEEELFAAFVDSSPDYDVTLKFAEKELYAPRVFLSMASPVFEKELNVLAEEKMELVLDLKPHDYDNALKFLQCLHPRLETCVTEDNVYDVLPLAYAYDVDGMLARCESVLLSILKQAQSTKAIRISKTSRNDRSSAIQTTGTVLSVLSAADEFDFATVIKQGVAVMKEAYSYDYLGKPAFENLSLSTKYELVKAALLRNEQCPPPLSQLLLLHFTWSLEGK